MVRRQWSEGEDEYGIYSDVTDGQSSHSALIRYAVGPHAPPQRAPLALTPSRIVEWELHRHLAISSSGLLG